MSTGEDHTAVRGGRTRKMAAVAKSWEANGVARRSYGGTEGDISGLKRSGSEILCRTMNGATDGSGTWLDDDDQAEWRRQVKDEQQCYYSVAKKIERKTGNREGERRGHTRQKGQRR